MPEIVDLDKSVVAALNFFSGNKPPVLDINSFNNPFVVGSGNAYNTGIIIFDEKTNLFADESNFRARVFSSEDSIHRGLIKQAVIISASGGKDSVWETKLAKEKGLKTTLMTTKSDSDAAKVADEVIVYQSIAEPYTYNVSTYMGMILSATGEDPAQIIQQMNTLQFPDNFGAYKSYAFVVPDRFVNICPMLDTKKDELFGPYLSIRAFSQGHARHAKFVIRSKGELVISLGEKNEFFGDPNHRWDIPLPADIGYAGVMAVTYYVTGRIQGTKPQYFKENISDYVNDYGPKAYGSTEPFDLIVPGSRKP